LFLRQNVERRVAGSTVPREILYHRARSGTRIPLIDEIYRSDWGRIVASLIRLVNVFDAAEEAVQEAFGTGRE
jgi:hypothetical protein